MTKDITKHHKIFKHVIVPPPIYSNSYFTKICIHAINTHLYKELSN